MSTNDVEAIDRLIDGAWEEDWIPSKLEMQEDTWEALRISLCQNADNFGSAIQADPPKYRGVFVEVTDLAEFTLAILTSTTTDGLNVQRSASSDT